MPSKRNRKQQISDRPVADGARRNLRVIGWGIVGVLLLVTAVLALTSRKLVSHKADVDIAAKVWQFEEPGLAPNATAAEMQEEAHAIASRLATAYPKSADALGVLARTYLRFRDEDSAEDLWRQALELDPQSVQTLFGLGLIGLARDDYDLAIDSFGRAYQLDYTDPRLPTALAEAFLKSGQVEQAIQILEQAIASRTASVETLLTLGQARFESEDFELSRIHYEAVLELTPHRLEAIYGLGRVHMRLGNRTEALQWLEKHRDLKKEEKNTLDVSLDGSIEDRRATRETLTQVCIDAGHVYRTLGDSSQAEIAWQKALTIAPNNVETHTELLALYEATSQLPAALACAMRLSELEPENAEHWINVGVLSATLRLPDQAIDAIETAIELDPDNPRCRQARKLINRR